MKQVLLALAALSLLGAGPLTVAPTRPPAARATPSAPTVLRGQGDGYSFQLNLDPAQGTVSITSLGPRQDLPDEMTVTLFRDDTTGDTVRVHAAPPVGAPMGARPEFEGRLDPTSQSFVAAELQFGVGGKKDRHRIRAEVLEEQRGTG